MSFRDHIEQIGAAVEYAAGTLPEGWIVVIQVEKGAGWVELQDREGNVVSFGEHYGPLPDDIKAAADAAHLREFGT